MSYTPNTDFLALLRSTPGGVESARMPGLDWAVEALARAGFISLSVGQTAPTNNQASTAWFQPALPSWQSEGTLFLWNAAVQAYQQATPALWSGFISGSFAVPGTALPLADGIASVGSSIKYSREDHVHPTDPTLAPLNSPTLVGTPTAPTPAFGDSSTLLATTAFVVANSALAPPVGSLLPYAGSVAPNANWQIAVGQAVSRTGTTAALFAVLGTTFGSGNGSTTFNVPDLRGRTVAGVDGGANRLTTATMSSQALGGVGGVERLALTAAQIPTITSTVTVSSVSTSTAPAQYVFATGGGLVTGNAGSSANPGLLGGIVLGGNLGVSTVTATGTGSGSATSNNTGSGNHNNVQPTIELNYILRVS